MTGIDRLRAIAGAWDEWGLGGALAEMADQIERERAEDCYRMGLDCGTAWRVVDDMERHCLGHEGMEDSPVARWARELRGALKSDTSEVGDTQIPSWHDPAEDADVTSDAPKVTRDPAEDVSMSAYDLLPADEREAIAWVRKHGGIDHVRAEWISRVPHDLYERSRQRLLDHIAECETALGRRREIISKLTHRVSDIANENAELRGRAMPEGMEWLVEAWPRFEDDLPVGLLDDFERYGEENGVSAVTVYADGSYALNFRAYSKGERVNRPAPKVLDADGAEIREKRDVWWICEGDERGVHAERLHVDGIDGDGMVECSPYNGGTSVVLDPAELYVKKPALDADGVLCREGDEVWEVMSHRRREIVGTHYRDYETGEPLILCDGDDAIPIPATCVTHTKPEPPDSWERIEEDADALVDAEINGEGSYNAANAYCNRRGLGEGTSFVIMAQDLVRRCRALAERERGE